MEKKFVPAKNYFAFTTTTTLNKIQEVAAVATDNLIEKIGELQLEPIGPIEFIYFDCTDDRDKEFTLEIALPVKETKEEVPSGYSFVMHDDFKCASYIHNGDLSGLYCVYDKIFSEIWDNSLRTTNQVREVYTKFVDSFSSENITEIQVGLQ